MKKLFIQANNLDTVIDVFMYIYLHGKPSKQEIANYCGFSLRQVDYYTNACKYLDLLNADWSPTELARDIFEHSSAEITERVYQRIIEDDFIGKIYGQINEPIGDVKRYALNLSRQIFPGYSEAVYDRRADNMVKWCVKIHSYLS